MRFRLTSLDVLHSEGLLVLDGAEVTDVEGVVVDGEDGATVLVGSGSGLR